MKGLNKLTLASALMASAAWTGAVSAQTTELTIVLPNPSAINNFALHVADGEGYLAEEGLSINVEAVNGSASVLQLMASGQADIGQPGPAPLLGARARGEDVVFIYNHFSRSIFGLVVPEESEAQGPADLAGTVVGVGTADGAEVGFARGILGDAGLSEGDDYEFLAIGDGGTAVAAFLNEEVEAYSAAVSDAAIISSRGVPLREITPEEYLSYFGNGWAVTREFLENNREAIEGFGRAMVKGTIFGLNPDNIDATLAHTTAANPQEGEDEEFAKALLAAIQSRVIPVDLDDPYGYQPPEAWQDWQDVLVSSGEMEAPMDDLESAYTNEFVETWNAVE